MISNMQEIDKLRSPVQEVHVPLEVFEYIDGGRNPQLYTKDCMEKALAKNEQVRAPRGRGSYKLTHSIYETKNKNPRGMVK